MMRRLKISLVFLFCCTGLQLQAQTAKYQFKRPLSGAGSTWHILQLPDALFAHTRPGLEDLRIYGVKGTDTVQVPFLIKQRSDQVKRTEIPFAQINESLLKDSYYYTFQSPDGKAALINQIGLDFKTENFDWKVLLEGSNDSRNWFTILKDYRILSIKNKDTDYQFTTLNFPDSRYQYFRVSFESQRKPALISAKIAVVDTVKGIYQKAGIRGMQISNDRKSQETVASLELDGLIPVSAVRFRIGNDFDYYRTFRIEYVTDSFQTDKGMQYNYTSLYSGTLTSLEQTSFNFSNTLARRLRITIENNDNIPLRLTAIEVMGNTFELIARFDDPSFQYALFYGNDQATAPNYEIGNFEDKIPDALTAVSIGKEEKNPAYRFSTTKPLFENKIWLWVLMTIIIAILGGFSYKMLKN